MQEIADFYNKFSERQVAAGINHRHLSIIHHLKESGLKGDDRILEVGCGIGTVSELVLRHLTNKGYLKALDISQKSVDIARKRLRKYSNVSIEVRDLTQEPINDLFDVVILPDVIEHIPLSLHRDLFERIAEVLQPKGFVFIHIPHPNHLEWMVNTGCQELQILEQPIFTNELCETVYPIGFYLHSLKSYSVYSVENDYQVIILKKKPETQESQKMNAFYLPPLSQRILNKFRYLLRGLK